MIGNIKTGKRRAYQDIMQKVFRVEETTSDEEFEKAVRWFRLYEKELSNILKQAREFIKSISAYAVASSVLCSTFNRNFAGNSDSTTSSEQVLGVDTLSMSSELKNQEIEMVLLPSISQFLFDNVQSPVHDLLAKEFPKVKRSIAYHNGLRKDLESYRRRVRKLQRNGKDVGDKELDKLVAKLKATQIDYNNTHQDLISQMRRLCMEKHAFLEPCFTALCIVQNKFSKDMIGAVNNENLNSDNLNERLKSTSAKLTTKLMDEIETSRRRMDENKENKVTTSVKTPFTLRKLKKKFTPKMTKYKSLSFRGLTRSGSTISHQISEENPIIGGVSDDLIAKDTHKYVTREEKYDRETSKVSASSDRRVSQESVRFSDYSEHMDIKPLQTDDTTAHGQTPSLSQAKRQVIDLDETEDNPYLERKIESVEDFSEDDEIASYFRN